MANKPSKTVQLKKKDSKIFIRKKCKPPITSNPFLNFFLSKSKVLGSSKLHIFAKRVGEEWVNMNYHEKTPYYLLADKARMKRARKSERTPRKRKNHKEVIEQHCIPKTEHGEFQDCKDVDVERNGGSKDQSTIVAPPKIDEIPKNVPLGPFGLSVCSIDTCITSSFHSMKNNCSDSKRFLGND